MKRKKDNGVVETMPKGFGGFFRLQIKEKDGTVVGDSGWKKNQLTNLGVQYCLVENLMGGANSARVSYMGLGTGGAVATDASDIGGATRARKAVNSSVVSSRTAQMTASWASGDHGGGAAINISNVGLYTQSTGTASSVLFGGQSYASSAWNSNQSVDVTYQVRFPSS